MGFGRPEVLMEWIYSGINIFGYFISTRECRHGKFLFKIISLACQQK
jgi:queuine/archaeosine tRNA-ribosyltransferase